MQPDTDAAAVKMSDELHASDSVIMAPAMCILQSKTHESISSIHTQTKNKNEKRASLYEIANGLNSSPGHLKRATRKNMRTIAKARAPDASRVDGKRRLHERHNAARKRAVVNGRVQQAARAGCGASRKTWNEA